MYNASPEVRALELRGKTALVTGATGCIGGRLAERLAAEEGVSVRGMVRNPAKARRLRSAGVDVVVGDLTRPDSLKAAVEGCEIVFHCAARVSDWGTRKEFYEENVQGTKHMLDAALAAGVERFVHISSIGVYGFGAGPGTDESSPHRASGDLYCDTKIEAEQLACRYQRELGLPVVIIQPGMVYGPHAWFYTIRPVEMIRAGVRALVSGGRGTCILVYIDNLVDGIILATRHEGAVGEAFILCDLHLTFKELFEIYARMMGGRSFLSIPKPVAWLGAMMLEGVAHLTGRRPAFTRTTIRALTIFRATMTTTKAREQLGYTPRVSLEEGMRSTESWLQKEGYLPKGVSGEHEQARNLNVP